MTKISELQLATKTKHPPLETMQTWVKLVFTHENNKLPILIRLVDEAESAELNVRFRHKEGATNVLSFIDEPTPGFASEEQGQLVICAPLVEAEARALNIPAEHHWAHLVTHGCLHLLGYTHTNDTDAHLMESKEIKLLAELNIASPYK